MTPEEHYKALYERYYKDSMFYQAQLFHSWRVIQGQQKGLRRSKRRNRRLRAELSEAKRGGVKWQT